jgi:BASS family bile acid:Na+ symporter
LARPVAKVAMLVMLVIVLLLIYQMRQAFVGFGWQSYLAVALSAAAALAFGHFLAPRDARMKKALAVETALRNPALALMIASVNFPEAKPLPILLPCVLVSGIIVFLYAALQSKRASHDPGN